MAEVSFDIDSIDDDISDQERREREALAAHASGKPSLAVVAPAAPVSHVVRDGYSMPEADFDIFDEMSERIVDAKLLQPRDAYNRSLILRAGLHALRGLDDSDFAAVMKKAPPLKTGRKSRR